MANVKVTCKKPLLSDSSGSLLRSSKTLMSLYELAVANRSTGDAVFELTCDAIDAGGVLLLMNAAFRTGRLGWQVQACGVGNAWDNLLLHVNHFLTPKEKRQPLDDQRNYLLRDLQTREEMVVELEKWARMVQSGSGASDEDVALWQSQISEVAANLQNGRRYLRNLTAYSETCAVLDGTLVSVNLKI